jgi:hypothetical protein
MMALGKGREDYRFGTLFLEVLLEVVLRKPGQMAAPQKVHHLVHPTIINHP